MNVSPRLPLRPTMRDVAALAHVGLKTVSRVVNGEPGVATETAERVRAAIARLDYRPDVNASSLRRLGGKTATIGLLLEDVGNPFSSALHRAVEDCARERGVLVFTGSCDEDARRERDLVETFRTRRVDGFVVVPAGADHSYLASERERGTAIVFVDRPARFLDADAVVSDNVGGGALATRHLIAHGHERVAFLGDLPGIATAAERLRGYREAMASAGASIDEHHVRLGLRSAESAEAAVAEMLGAPQPPTAIFAGQNLLTIGAIHALRRAGLQHRVALVGFDDVALADLLDPAITVVAQQPSALGRRAAELLFRRLDGDTSPSAHIVLDVELVARGSGEISRPTDRG